MRAHFLPAIASVLFIGFAAARAAGAPVAHTLWIDQSLAAGKIHEECMTLKRGDQLEYAFEARSNLDFNIHYHVGDAVHFPVKETGATRAESVFRPAIEQGYCLMWSNPGAIPVEFRYRFKVHAD